MRETYAVRASVDKGDPEITVYSTEDSIAIRFRSGSVECGSWISEKAASNLIELLQAVLLSPETPKVNVPSATVPK